MGINEGDRAVMAALLIEEKQARERIARAEELIARWQPRIALAEQRGRSDLALEARRQLEEALREREAAQHEVERIAQEKAMLRHEVNRPAGNAAGEAHAEVLLESFREIGVDPEAVELKELERENTAEDALAALKARMKLQGDR